MEEEQEPYPAGASKQASKHAGKKGRQANKQACRKALRGHSVGAMPFRGLFLLVMSLRN